MNERKVFVYSIEGFEAGDDFWAILGKVRYNSPLNGCRFVPKFFMKHFYPESRTSRNEFSYFLLLDNPLPSSAIVVPIVNFVNYSSRRPYAIIQVAEFTATWKKNSKNREHILHSSFGGECFIGHYAESIIKNLNKLELCKEIRI